MFGKIYITVCSEPLAVHMVGGFLLRVSKKLKLFLPQKNFFSLFSKHFNVQFVTSLNTHSRFISNFQ